MRQPRAMSLVEAVANAAVGYAVALAAQLVVFPAVGLAVTLGQNLAIGAAFSAVSIVRSYALTLAALLNQEQIADYLGIGRTTFHRIMQRDPDIEGRYKRGKAKAIAHVANGLLQKARGGCTTSSIFYLKTQAGWRETERLEHSGPDGGPVEVKRLDLEADAQRFLDRLARLQQYSRPLPGAESPALVLDHAEDEGDDGAR